MKKRSKPNFLAGTFIVIVLAISACGSPTGSGSASPASSSQIPVSGGGNAGNHDASTATSTPMPTPTATLTSTPTPTQTDTPTPTPPAASGPYQVKQIESLGGETIEGTVCSTLAPFQVTVHAKNVTFAFLFTPNEKTGGSIVYGYNISSAGESHDAKGKYTLTSAQDGSLLVSLSVSDHVVFHGFDGKIPNRYKFKLIPADNLPCPVH